MNKTSISGAEFGFAVAFCSECRLLRESLAQTTLMHWRPRITSLTGIVCLGCGRWLRTVSAMPYGLSSVPEWPRWRELQNVSIPAARRR